MDAMQMDTGSGHGPSDEAPVEPGRKRRRLVSRVRALANAVLLVAGLLFLLGFVVVAAGTRTMSVYALEHISLVVSYLGLIAFAAFVTSVVSIIIENRTARENGGGVP